MRFLTKFALALTIPAFVPAEPYPPLATLAYTGGTSAWRECASPRAIDGTSIRCGTKSVRLVGIDAGEDHRCPSYSPCVQGDPVASRLSLQQAVSSGPVRYRIIERGRYVRAVAIVAVNGGNLNLSCWQIWRGRADYVAEWDKHRLVARSCRPSLRRGEEGSNSRNPKFVPLKGAPVAAL
jgi:endonuclease YncB( thermonuclease family)